MKTNKIISVALLVAMISTIGLTSASASYGQWNGQWSSMTEEQREEMQNMTEEEREAYMEENEIEIQDDDGDWIPNKDDEDFERDEDGENKPEDAWNWNKSWNGSEMAEQKWNSNSALKAKYKNTYEEKYWALISKMDDEGLNTFIDKIDDIAETVETWDYSNETKEKFNAMLDALREIAEDNLDIEDELLDWLFE
jgi:hypothetical protein